MSSEARTEDPRVHTLETALRLVWNIHVRRHTHLGLERFSGIERRCIPCICAMALGRAIDSGWPEMFDEELRKIEAETSHE